MLKKRKIQPIMKISKNYEFPIIFSMLITLTFMQGWVFSAGYRVSADDIYFQSLLFNSFANAVEYTNNYAVSQGRIGQYISVPLIIFGSYFADINLVRYVFVGLFFLQFFLIAKVISNILHKNVSLYLYLIMISMAYVGPGQWNHLPPFAYPILITAPILAILYAKLWRSKYGADRFKGWKLNAYVFIMASAMLVNEFAFLFGSGFLILEVTAEFVMRSKITIRKYFPDIRAIFFSLAVYFLFRLTFPSEYPGNIPDGIANVSKIIKTLFGHIVSGGPFLLLANNPNRVLEVPSQSQYMLAGIFGIMAGFLLFFLLERFKKFSCDWRFIIACFMFSVYVCIPVAITVKYQDWCSLGVCTYIDSRVAYYGFAIGIGLIVIFLENILIMQQNIKFFFRFVLVSLFGCISAFNFLNNEIVQQSMHQYTNAWKRAQHIACTVDDLSNIKNDFMADIDPDELVHYHPNFDIRAYWINYMTFYKKNAAC